MVDVIFDKIFFEVKCMVLFDVVIVVFVIILFVGIEYSEDLDN